MLRRRAPLLLAVLAIALSSCGSDDSRVAGEWNGQFVKTDGSKVPGASLTLTKEHHWREVYRNLVVEGRWSLAGNKLELVTELFNGALVADAKKLMLANAAKTSMPEAAKSMAQNLEQPMDLTLSADGKTLLRNDGLVGGSVIYTKQP